MIREDIDRVIGQILYDVVHNETKFTETYRKEIINLIVDKLTVMNIDGLTVGEVGCINAQIQHTIKEIKE